MGVRPSRHRILLCVWSTLIFWLQALAWPFSQGRDGYSYLYYAYDFLNPQPEDYFTVLFRTPVAGLFARFLVDGLGSRMAELFLWGAFVGVVLVLYEVASRWGRSQAFLFAGLMCAQPGWASLFHIFSNDPPLAMLMPVLLWALLHANGRRVWSAVSGLLTGLALLIRPGVFLGFAAALFVSRRRLKERFLRVFLFLLAAAPLYGGWVYRNHHQFGITAFAPAADVLFPMARLLAVEKTVRPENGPASRELARVIETSILAGNPEFEGWTAKRYLRERAGYFDLVLLADRAWGKGQYGVLKAAAWEALRTDPFTYLTGSLKNLGLTFLGNLKFPVPLTSGARVHTHKGHVSFMENGADRWVPVQGFDFSVSRHDPVVAQKMKERGKLSQAAWEKSERLPSRDGSILAGTFWNGLAYLFPPMALWIALGMIGWVLVGVRGVRDRVLLCFVLIAFLTNTLACFSIWSVVYEYRLPFDPVYVLFGWIPWVRFLRIHPGKWRIFRLG